MIFYKRILRQHNRLYLSNTTNFALCWIHAYYKKLSYDATAILKLLRAD